MSCGYHTWSKFHFFGQPLLGLWWGTGNIQKSYSFEHTLYTQTKPTRITVLNTYSFSHFINLMVQEIAVAVKMLFLEWSLPYNFVWHLPFQIHEKFQHLKAHNVTLILHKNNVQALIQCSTLSEIAWHCLQVPRLHLPTILTRAVLGWIWVCSIGRMIWTGSTKYS